MEFDLTAKLSEFMDKHMIVHLLDHLMQINSTNEKNEEASEEKTLESAQSEQENENGGNKVSLVSKIPMKEDDSKNENKDDALSFYSTLNVNEAIYRVLDGTFMVDEQSDIRENLSQLIDDNGLNSKKIANKEKLEQRKKTYIQTFNSYQEKCSVLLDLFSDEQQMTILEKQKNLNMTEFQTKFNITYKDLDNLYEYCRLRYETGQYKNTDRILKYFIELYEIDPSKQLKARFGKLAIEILEEKWQDAITNTEKIFKDIDRMGRVTNRVGVTAIGATVGAGDVSKTEENEEANESDDKKEESKVSDAAAAATAAASTAITTEGDEAVNAAQSAANALRQKAWLLHWNLFIYFNQNDGAYLDSLVQLFIDNMTTIETIAPHLLRYLAAAVLISESINDKLQKLVEISKYIDEEQYTYKDPITEFVRLVVRANDFDGASEMLKLAYNVCKNDFFLCYYSHYFLQYARLVFVRKYCRLFSVIDVSKLSRKLWLDHLSNEDVQNWVVNAVREIQTWSGGPREIDARLDVGNNILYVQVKDTNPYQVMVEKTKQLTIRTVQIIRHLNTNDKFNH